MEKIFYAWLLIVASAAAFSGLRQAQYVWDDRRALGLVDTTDQPVRTAPAAAIRESWKINQGEPYQPVTRTLWSLVQAVSPDQQRTPSVMHWLSFGLHVANSILVMLILTLALQSSGAAFVGALLFALHPLQVEPVAYIAATPYVLGAFFALLALWQYLVYGEMRTADSRTSARRPLQVATISFILALLTTPATAITPLVAMLLVNILPKRSSLSVSRVPVWPLFLWALLAIAPVIWAIRADPTQTLADQTPFWYRPFVAGDALMFYITKLLAPVMLGPDYGRSPKFVMDHWWGYLTWLLPFIIVMFIGYSRGQLQRIFLAAFGIFVTALLPYLGFILFSKQATSTVANTFSYFAMLGPALGIAGAVALGRRAWLPAVFAVAIASFGYLTFRNVLHWQNDKALWEHAIVINPNSPVVHATLGDTYRREGQWEKAKMHYEQVLKVNQINPDIHFYLGEIEQRLGSAAKASALFEKTLELNPNFTEAHNRLGLAYYDQGNYEKALVHFQKAVDRAPNNGTNLRYLGMLYVRRGQYNEAIPYLEKALGLTDGSQIAERAQSHALLGLALSRTGQGQKAQTHLESAVKLDPNDHIAQRTLGDIYYGQSSFHQARPHYEKAVKANPKDPELNRNLGNVLAYAKEYDQAVVYFNKALEIKPDWPEVLTSLGTSYFHLKRTADASETLKRSLALKPDQADPHQVLGDIARWQGKNAEANGEYYRALKINPDHPEANYRLGNWFLKKERRAEAIHHYKIALRGAPNESRYLSQLRRAERNTDAPEQGSADATM
ncbi:MAG TPA: tetratricopeptide repeat protein [Oligoflexus sp.]|uniref:tetratricopeptide repeat protein n=1 Tax=Oligoflexus sp. TaxID=1971216 RepID=UPI002D72F724|nr:tetratricopeptide repeat protein [Oligoflexus sp.]HYX32005.1 tetratricopeptide repeat protein [Oligoflexus sp.]